MKIIVGLGNPDKKYDNTRHNLGFKAVERLAAEQGLTWHEEKSFNALVAKGLDAYFVKPLTYMNNSGQAVQKIMNYYHLLPEQKNPQVDLNGLLTVIHDDLDIELGQYKFSTGGSAGGHNGVQSIIEALGTGNFSRLRIGVASEKLARARHSLIPGGVARFVLKRLPKAEQTLTDEAITQGLKLL